MDNNTFETRELSFRDMIHYQDIQVAPNKANFIVGPSGTGKSTLLRLFNGALSPSNGSIFYQGKDITEIDTIELRKDVLLISQSVYLFDMTIKENFLQYYEYRDMAAPTDDKMIEYLKLCSISFPLDKDCSTMSGGERQRVYIAIYLSFMPKVLMLDEPTSALDRDNSYNVMSNVLRFCKEKEITVIVVSHDQNITDTFAENIIKIDGREQ